MGYRETVTIDAPTSVVWAAWTSVKETQAWLAPRADMVFEVDGAYEFFWDEDPEIDSTLGCRLLAIEPEARLLFEWRGKDESLEMFVGDFGPTEVEVRFEASAPGGRRHRRASRDPRPTELGCLRPVDGQRVGLRPRPARRAL